MPLDELRSLVMQVLEDAVRNDFIQFEGSAPEERLNCLLELCNQLANTLEGNFERGREELDEEVAAALRGLSNGPVVINAAVHRGVIDALVGFREFSDRFDELEDLAGAATTEREDSGAGLDHDGPGGALPSTNTSWTDGDISMDRAAAVARVPAVLSAWAPDRVGVGVTATVEVRIEPSEAARPLANLVMASLQRGEQVGVVVVSNCDAIEVLDPWFRATRLPTKGSAAELEFPIRGVKPGSAVLAVRFLQGSSSVGALELPVVVSNADKLGERLNRETYAADRELRDDVLSLIIDERRSGNDVRLQYMVTSERLGLHCEKFESEPFLRGGGRTPRDYIAAVYRRFVDQTLRNRNDAERFRTEVRAIGVDLCSQLLGRELVRALWNHRDELETIAVTSWDHLIPWELVRLRHPDQRGSAGIDDRFFSEYPLIREMVGKAAPPLLRWREWVGVRGAYLERAAVGTDLDILDGMLARFGRQVGRLEPDSAQVLTALASGSFHVLHFVAHGSATLGTDATSSEIVLSERKNMANNVETISLDSKTVGMEADLTAGRPLVFVNACASAQSVAGLTDYGGWPRAFIDAGAGAYVGTSWPVRDRPAEAFAREFYEVLLSGESLSRAAAAARNAARSYGEASWLAYVVFGRPSARFMRDD